MASSVIDQASAALRRRPALALVLVWAAMALFVWPVGEFAINDDWGFSAPVKWWSEDGFLQFTFWQAMTLIAQVFLGFMWSEAFGFSQTGLRILTALLAALFLVAGYGLARECGLSKRAALTLPALYLALPHFVMSSSTFMTDTPFLALAVAALYFFARVINGRARRWPLDYALALTLMSAAILTRQVGLMVAVGFFAGDIAANGPRLKILARAGAALALAVGLYAAYPAVIEPIAGLPAEFGRRTSMLGGMIADVLSLRLGALLPMVNVGVWGLLHAGLLAIPLSGALLAGRLRAADWRRADAAIAIAAALALFGAAVLLDSPITAIDNVLTTEGLGPRLIWPYSLGLSRGPFWQGLTLLACLSLGVLAAELARTARAAFKARDLAPDRPLLGLMTMLVVTAVAGYLPYGIFYGPWFVRYIFLPAFCLLLVCARLGEGWDAMLQRGQAAFILLAAVGAVSSAILARDYFAWARARGVDRHGDSRIRG